MNKNQIISKLSGILFLIISLFFSCGSEVKEMKDNIYVPYKFEIDSANASVFAKLFIQNIYNSDTIGARSKISINYKGDSIYINNLLGVPGLYSELDLFTQFNKKVLIGAELSLVKYTNHQNVHSLLLRLFTAPLEVDYFKLILDVKGNKIKISDYSSFMHENSCQIMMEELIDLVYIKGHVDLDEVDKAFNLIDSTVIAFNNLEPDLASVFFSKMDSKLRATKVVDLVKFNLEMHSSSEIRLSAINRKEFSTGDMDHRDNLFYFRFYKYFENRKFSVARSSLKKLVDSQGKDAILIYLEAVTYFEEYNYSTAVELYNEALTIEPTIPNIHFAKVVCLIEMKEFVQAVESLLVMEDYFDVTNTNWDKEFMAYPAFLISDEYFQWLERVGVIKNEELL